MPEIKVVILDYDGVMADSLKPTMEALNSLAKKYKYPEFRNKDEFVKALDKNLIDAFTALGISSLRMPLFLNDLKKKLKEENKKLKLVPGIAQLTGVLSEHFKLALVSYNFKDLVTEILTREKIKDKFATVIAEEPTVRKSKKIKECLEKLGVKMSEAVFVCDTFSDVMEGKDAHVSTIAVTWGYQLRPRILPASPDFIVDKPSELLEALNVIMQG